MRNYDVIRVIEKNGEKLQLCTNCEEYLPFESFTVNQRTSTKRNYVCKTCHNSKVRSRKKVVVSDKIVSDQILTSLGYDVESDIPIHEQFKIRHYSK